MRNLEKFQSQQLNDTELLSIRGGNPILAAAGIAVAYLVDHLADGGTILPSNPDYSGASGSTAGAGALAGAK